ncbi:ATP-binding protein [Mycolicibacterium hodleri]|uniref:ATP-binding protein n=1 Tax=Mycolicibacterium hodleri TaxID=49897 RepID=A0A502DVD5_9MYCO|nr:ATP-binding protein [Mycolicibacterium hodleri]TPG28196.1 ATP-binding protein [Mycolicibacterium hodleri]
MTEHALETVTGPNTLAQMQHTLDAAWAADDVPEYTRMCMDLAVSEIGTNIIEHSNDGQPVKLRMVVTVERETVSVVLNDDARSVAVDLGQMTGMPHDSSERGRGLAIAYRVLDQLWYSRSDQGNHWRLTRKRFE